VRDDVGMKAALASLVGVLALIIVPN